MGKEPTKFNQVINERETVDYTCILQDKEGNVLAGSAIVSLTLTLFEISTGTIINTRENQDVLNTNNITVDENGVLLFQLQSEDGSILVPECEYETHRAEFSCVFNGGNDRSTWDVDFFYRNLLKLST